MTVTIKVWTGQQMLDLDMPGATSVRYAVMRAAEAAGCNPDEPHSLTMVSNNQWRRLRDDEIMADFDGLALNLAHFRW